MASRSIARADPVGTALIVVRLAAMIALLLACLPLHYLWRLSGAVSPWPRFFLGRTAWICGARVQIIGSPLCRDVLFVANHLSWIDILVMAGATGTAFIAKDGLAATPVVGWLSRLNNTVFVARGDRLSVAGQVEAVRTALMTPQPLTIFPEGTTGDGHGLGPFKASLLAVMAPPPRPMRIQPVMLDYGAAAPDLAWVGDEHGAANALRLLRRRRGFAVTLHFLDPFDPAADRKAIAAEARKRIAAALSASLGGRAIV